MLQLQSAITTRLGADIRDSQLLQGGDIGMVYRVTLTNGHAYAVKVADAPHVDLNIEGEMLQYLRDHTTLPIPEVIHNDRHLLIMDFIEGSSRFSPMEQQHAAGLIASLHAVSAPQFGFEKDTVIAQLPQPNPWTKSWINFFREHRLLHMAHMAYNAGELPAMMLTRLESFAGKLERYLEEPAAPSLLHGDLWTTNILARGGHIVGLIDPAIYYGHAEIELAFSTLFGTFSAPFFNRYQEIRPIAPGFFEERRDIYNLYPLLVHVRLFGAGYVTSVNSILSRFGA